MKKVLLTLMFIASLFVAKAQDETFSKTWNFSTWEQKNYTDVSKKDDMTVYGNVTVGSSNKTIEGTKYTNTLKLGGAATFDATTGEPATRALAFDVPGSVEVRVALTSSNSSGTGRNLTLWADTKETEIGKYEAPAGSVEVATYTYQGEAATLILGSDNSGINLYFVEVKEIAEAIPAPESLIIYADNEFEAENVDDTFTFERVAIRGIDGEAFFHFEDAEGNVFGAENDNTFVTPNFEFALVANGENYQIAPGIYNVTVDWNKATVIVEKYVVESSPITVYWDNSNTPSFEQVFAMAVFEEGVEAPENVVGYVEEEGIYLLTTEYIDGNIYSATLPSATLIFGFTNGTDVEDAEAYIIVDLDNGDFVAPTDGHLYTGIEDEYMGIDMGVYTPEVKNIAIYWNNTEINWTEPCVVYLNGDLAHSTEDDYVTLEMERCNKVPAAVNPAEGIIFDYNTFTAIVPNVTPLVAFFDKSAPADKYVVVNVEKSLAAGAHVYMSPRENMVYSPLNYEGITVAVEEGRFIDVVTPTIYVEEPGAPVQIFFDNTVASYTTPMLMYSMLPITMIDFEEPDDLVAMVEMERCAELPNIMPLDESDDVIFDYMVFSASLPENAAWFGFYDGEGSYLDAILAADRNYSMLQPVAEHVYGLEDADDDMVVDLGAYYEVVTPSLIIEEPGEPVNIYLDNTLLHFAQPTIVYSMIPIEYCYFEDDSEVAFSEMTRCAEVPGIMPFDDVVESTIFDYNVFAGKLPVNAAWFGIFDAEDEDGFLNAIVALEVIGDFAPIKPVAEHVYGLEDPESIALSDFGLYDDVVNVSGGADPGEMLTVYFFNRSAWEEVDLFYMTADGVQQLIPMAKADAEFEYNSWHVDLDALYVGQVPANALVFGFSDGIYPYIYQDEDEEPLAPVGDKCYVVNEFGAVELWEPDGVDAIAADGKDALYYNLQGVRVERPATGIYVRVIDGKAQKINVK